MVFNGVDGVHGRGRVNSVVGGSHAPPNDFLLVVVFGVSVVGGVVVIGEVGEVVLLVVVRCCYRPHCCSHRRC